MKEHKTGYKLTTLGYEERVNITVDKEIMKAVRDEKLNASELCEKALKRAIKGGIYYCTRPKREGIYIALSKYIVINMNTTQIFEKSANYKDSIAFLKSKGMRLLTYQEALVWLNKDSEAKSKLKGRWFYLAGNGTELSGFYTFDDKGELKQGKGDMEKNVFVCDGNNPLSLNVHTDDDARDIEGRSTSMRALCSVPCCSGGGWG